jgi:hypothetical protein
LPWNGKIGVVLRNRFGCHWLASPPTKPQKYSKPMPFGHCSKGPAWLLAKKGVLWSLPNHEVAYPLSLRIVPMVPFSIGMIES